MIGDRLIECEREECFVQNFIGFRSEHHEIVDEFCEIVVAIRVMLKGLRDLYALPIAENEWVKHTLTDRSHSRAVFLNQP